MEKQPFTKRVLKPTGLVSVFMLASWIVYNLAWRLDSGIISDALAAISGTALFLSVTLGAFYVYPAAYFRGATLPERILATFAAPLLWATKECVRLYVSFSLAECVYYLLNPLNIALFLWVVAQMGLAEMLCRRRLASNGEPIGMVTAGSLAAVIVGVSLVIALFTVGQGESAYVIFLTGYRNIFGSGL